MLVYRLCKEDEISTILETKNISVVGKYCSNTHRLNNHVYNNNKKYLHFFLEEYEITNLNPYKGNYICTYDIPEYLIEKYLGIGYYRSIFDLETLKKINECAIPSELITFSYLLKIERITKYLEFEDYLDDINKFKEEIYLKKTSKIKTKKI